MKKLNLLALIILATSFSLSVNAIPSFPRDLKCQTQSGDKITLKSNNSLWAQSSGSRFEVLLDVNELKDMPTTWTNNRAMHTRGNDTGIREYIFVSPVGETFFVSLEFFAPFGQATGIKSFRVRSQDIQFDNSQRSLRSKTCEVIFYSKTDI